MVLPGLWFLYVDQALFDFDGIGRNGIRRRQSCDLAGAKVKTSPMTRALDLMIQHVTIAKRAAIMGAEIGDTKVLAADV